ncbi:assimilatory sulfite reductase (NADPH) hemoprotein subunit [Pallidibacillus thermolactis]|jgi:sulfite reductase (NADPH) hemoprotein beta-component|uniref:assimilatory sulfite reductase (NADPH) hemoprotein subunit n=1 Tax=Pallidibacillus thermolactis TaxID=251051 RepID=UPI002E1F2130|nr:assimilatory sulfite reductase (NADPH) hemoprotein subunit [Pallidibacillus thermolactis subsp. kokeshiiformis]
MSINEELIVKGKLSDNERIKKESNYLRGTLEESLQDPITGSISPDDTQLIKFHGSYQQDDRDVRDERRRKKLEPAYQFMVRARITGGIVTPEQWLALDKVAATYGNGTLRITTRQTFQFHGVLKWDLKSTIRKINEAMISTLATCGDVNRNVVASANPHQSALHQEVYEWAKKISDHLLPSTPAYHEIWLDGEKVVDRLKDLNVVEPIYGQTYLPRKFKIGIAIPPENDVDVYSQDIGLIAIIEENELKGFNVLVGGGMGMTHGDRNTYPQLAKLAGFTPKEKVVDVCEKIITIQRDYGNRTDRKNARFKYTIDRLGLEWFKEELANRLGWSLEESRPFKFKHNGDRYGWVKGENGNWHLTLFIQSGRISDTDNYPLMTGLREIAKIHKGEFRLTTNQNVIIANVPPEEKSNINKLVKKYKLTDGKHFSALRRYSMSCVGFPTCGLAMAESERYFPKLLDKLEEIIDEAGLHDNEIVIRMTGCPNGCARPALAEIAFVGKAPGKYNVYLGGSFTGDRLNQLYKENIGEKEILDTLRPILFQYAKERKRGERFGDFVIRAGFVEEVKDGRNFHNQKEKLKR